MYPLVIPGIATRRSKIVILVPILGSIYDPLFLPFISLTKEIIEYWTTKTNESATYAVDVNFNGSIFVMTKRVAKKNTIVIKTIMNHIMSMWCITLEKGLLDLHWVIPMWVRILFRNFLLIWFRWPPWRIILSLCIYSYSPPVNSFPLAFVPSSTS